MVSLKKIDKYDRRHSSHQSIKYDDADTKAKYDSAKREYKNEDWKRRHPLSNNRQHTYDKDLPIANNYDRDRSHSQDNASRRHREPRDLYINSNVRHRSRRRSPEHSRDYKKSRSTDGKRDHKDDLRYKINSSKDDNDLRKRSHSSKHDDVR